MLRVRNSIIALGFFLAIFVLAPAAGRAQAVRQTAQTATASSVKGSGTPGRIVKWAGAASPSVDVADSVITEVAGGLVGIGTTAPTSKLTVAGTIQTTAGGFMFPDGTVQTTAGLSSTFHDETLKGDGTSGAPLGIAPGQTVRSINGLADGVNLVAGQNISITPSGNTLTIASTAADPARNAFQKDIGLFRKDGEGSTIVDMPVPAGKRLVIEYLSVFCIGDDIDVIFITTKVNGMTAVHTIQPSQVVNGRQGSEKQVRIYADGNVNFQFDGPGALGTVSVGITVSGYLVDMQ